MSNEFKLGRYEIELDNTIQYQMFGSDATIKEIIEYDFEHITQRLHQRLVVQSLRVWNAIPVTFQRNVYFSLMTEQDASPYWNKSVSDQVSVYKRESTKHIQDDKEQKAFLGENDLTQQVMKNKKNRITNKLVEMGYQRAYTMEMFNKYISEKGTGFMSLKPTRIIELLDEYIADNAKSQR